MVNESVVKGVRYYDYDEVFDDIPSTFTIKETS